MDNGASCHMTGAWELFSQLLEDDVGINVELGYDVKYVVREQGPMQFQRESWRSFDAEEVLYVLGLKNLLSILVMEDKGYVVTFKKG